MRDVPEEKILELPLIDRIQVDERFVEEYERRIMKERRREHEFLARAFREILAEARSVLVEVEEIEPPRDPRLEGFQVANPTDEIQVLECSEVRGRGLHLRDDPHQGFDPQGLLHHVHVEDLRPAGRRPQLSGEDPQHRRLAGAVRPEETEELSGLDAQVDFLEGVRVTIPLPQLRRENGRHAAADARRVI